MDRPLTLVQLRQAVPGGYSLEHVETEPGVWRVRLYRQEPFVVGSHEEEIDGVTHDVPDVEVRIVEEGVGTGSEEEAYRQALDAIGVPTAVDDGT